MFALLLSIAGALTLLGVVLAPLLVTVFTPGFEGERRALMISVVRIVFPMTGVLVLSAWALGVLNSHRHFFLPYFAPVLWNAAIIAVLVWFSSRVNLEALLMAALFLARRIQSILDFRVLYVVDKTPFVLTGRAIIALFLLGIGLSASARLRAQAPSSC